jgi:hypothetical protein
MIYRSIILFYFWNPHSKYSTIYQNYQAPVKQLRVISVIADSLKVMGEKACRGWGCLQYSSFSIRGNVGVNLSQFPFMGSESKCPKNQDNSPMWLNLLWLFELQIPYWFWHLLLAFTFLDYLSPMVWGALTQCVVDSEAMTSVWSLASGSEKTLHPQSKS